MINWTPVCTAYRGGADQRERLRSDVPMARRRGAGRRMGGRVLQRMAVAFGAAAVFGGGWSAPAYAEFQVLSENVAGGVNNNVAQWSHAKTQQISNSIYNRGGDFIGFQEICRGQLSSVRDDLYYRYGRLFQQYLQVNVTGGDNSALNSNQCTYNASTGEFGNGLLLPRTAVSTIDYTLPDDGSAGRNGMLCAETTAENRAIEFCSTHFSPPDRDSSGSVRTAQSERVRDIAVYHGQYRGIVVAGDMNIKPDESYIQPLYSRLKEIDQFDSSINYKNSFTFPNDQSFGTLVKKIDYVFYGDYRVGSPVGARVEPVYWSAYPEAFDHRILPGLEMFMRAL